MSSKTSLLAMDALHVHACLDMNDITRRLQAEVNAAKKYP